MWFQFGRWIALGIHFGSPHRVSEAPDTHLIHTAIRVGTRTWSRNPRPALTPPLRIPSAIPTLPVQMPPEHESPSTSWWR